MSIRVRCPECQKVVEGGDDSTNLVGKCPNCGRVIEVSVLDPPTERQLNYAKKLRVKVTSSMSKWDVSAAIAKVESKNPSIARQRQFVNESRYNKTHGRELTEAEQEWQKLADSNKWMIAAYQRGNGTTVSVIRLNEATINEKGELIISGDIAEESVKHNREWDDSLIDLDKLVDLPLETITWYEIIDEIAVDGADALKAAMRRGEQTAKRLSSCSELSLDLRQYQSSENIKMDASTKLESSTYDLRLDDLDRDIRINLAKLESLERERNSYLKLVRSQKCSVAYLTFARWIRQPSREYGLWRFGVYLIGTLSVFVVCFIICDMLSLSVSLRLGISLSSAAGMLGLLAVLFNYPNDATLPLGISDAKARLHDSQTLLLTSYNEFCATRNKLKSVEADRAALVQSIEWKRNSLLRRDWRAMRDSAWEEYLSEVFCALGAIVQHTGKSGDQGVDLVVQFGNRRIAIQAKGYYHAVANKAVQEVVAGKSYYNCDSGAVITNSRFTRGAIDLALCNDCILIGESDIPDFVMGRLKI